MEGKTALSASAHIFPGPWVVIQVVLRRCSQRQIGNGIRVIHGLPCDRIKFPDLRIRVQKFDLSNNKREILPAAIKEMLQPAEETLIFYLPY